MLDTCDTVRQRVVSQHVHVGGDGRARLLLSPHGYIRPAELDLMGQLAGFELESRHADCCGTEFTAGSRLPSVGVPAAADRLPATTPTARRTPRGRFGAAKPGSHVLVVPPADRLDGAAVLGIQSPRRVPGVPAHTGAG